MAVEILIVDDNADIRNILNDLIVDAGYKARVAANYNQALSEIDKKIPDVAILDVKSVADLCADWAAESEWVYQCHPDVAGHHRHANTDDADRFFHLYGDGADLFAADDFAALCSDGASG